MNVLHETAAAEREILLVAQWVSCCQLVPVRTTCVTTGLLRGNSVRVKEKLVKPNRAERKLG